MRWSKLFPPDEAPRELPAKSPPPPPSPRPPSRIRSLATTSVMYFFWLVCLSSQERVCRRPSIYTLPPFFRYSPAISARRCQSTTLCHSVRSCHSPFLSLKRSLVARAIFATGVPLGVNFTSGSLPKLPIRVTRFKLLPAINAAPSAPFVWVLNQGAGKMKRNSRGWNATISESRQSDVTDEQGGRRASDRVPR